MCVYNVVSKNMPEKFIVKYKKLEIYELLEFLFAIYPNENPKK